MVKLTAASTASIPRVIIFSLTLVYGLAGLFERDPWKNEDAIGFGVMWTLHHGGLQDWLVPHLAGRDASMGAPLPYWLGALLMDWFGPFVGLANATRIYSALCFFAAALAIWYASYLLGRRPEVQPMSFALGGQPHAKEYGMTLADGALLIFLACVGIAQQAHETTPMMAQLMGVSLMLYGTIRGLDKPWQGGIWTGLGLAIVILSGNLIMAALLAIGTASAVAASNARLRFRWSITSIALGFIGLIFWPLLWLYFDLSAAQQANALEGWLNWPLMQAYPSYKSLSFLSINFWLYAWPVWPLALIALVHWVGQKKAGSWRAPHICIPLGIALGGLLYNLFRTEANDHDLIILIPPLSVLAVFSLPILKRNLISFIDWFAMLSFTVIGFMIWLIWFAKITGFPASTASNVGRYIPGFQAEFNLTTFIAAIIITSLWGLVIRWRTSRAPKVIWRCLIISASGTTLMWVLLMTLWLPTINYAKTYQYVAQRLTQAVPKEAYCIDTTHLGYSQLASFDYFTRLPLRDDLNCPWLLTHNPNEVQGLGHLNREKLTLLWEDRRAADRDERLRLYQEQLQ